MNIAELVVKATPQGMGEVNSELGRMEGKMQETEDNVGGTADKLGGLANTVKGAMKATVAGLAIGAAGLASQVPVVGELVSGLGAIVDALALKLDSKLRPTLNKLTNGFFDIAAAIDEGDYGKVKQEIADLAKELTGLEKLSPESVLTGFQNAVGDALNTVTTAFIDFEQGLTASDFESLFLRVGSFLKDGFVNAFKVLKNDVDWSSLLVSVIKFIGKALLGLAGAFDMAVIDPIIAWFKGLVGEARQFGVDLIKRFIEGIKSRVSDIGETIGGAEIAGGITVNDVAGSATGAFQTASNAGGDFIGSVGGSANKIFLDGQRVDDNQGRFRKDSLTRRGG